MTSRNVLDMDMDKESIAPYQQEIYYGTEKDQEVDSHFSYILGKRAPAPKFKEKLDKTPKGEGDMVYHCSNKFDILCEIESFVQLYPVKVKERYNNTVLIKYHHNLLHNILYQGELKIDGDHIQTIDTVYKDIYAQFFVTKKKMYNIRIGNVDCLQKWNTKLPGMKLSAPEPFSFYRKTQCALPIYKGDNKIDFEYKLKTHLSDLIKMKVRKRNKDGSYTEWKKCKPNLKYLEYNQAEIVPELWGRYSQISEVERNFRKSINPQTQEPEKQIIYAEDVNMTSSTNATPIGSKVEIRLESTHPAKHIFWVGQLENGNLSNYSTDLEITNGWNPCAKSAIKYGGSYRVTEMDHTHFDQSEPYDYFPGEPNEPGYNCYTFTYNPSLISMADNATILKKNGASLEVTLGNTNPFIEPEEEQEHEDEEGNLIPVEALEDGEDNIHRDKYHVHVRTVVERKMTVYWNENKNCLKYELS